MSIDAVSSVSSSSSTSSSSSSSSSSALSQETIDKLKALGLDPSQYSSEAEAQQAITDAQQKQDAQKSGGSGSSSLSTIKTEVEELASSMGISVGNSDKISDIMQNISDKISELQSSAGSDESKQTQVTGYNDQYTTISNELAQLEASRSMTGANALANYNKASLGLAA